MSRAELPADVDPDAEFNSPVSAARIDRVLGVMGLSSGQRILDFGCGNAEVLVRAAERYGVAGVGIDCDPLVVCTGRAKAARRVPGAGLVLHEADAAAFPLEEGSFDAALCIGAAHALGGYRAALRAMRRLVRAGGQVLVGELHWRREPREEYLAVLGEARADREDHAGNARLGGEEGLNLLYACASSEEEWDHFEGRHWLAALKAGPGEPVGEARRERVQAWRDAYLRWGRETLGFGLYLFQKASP